MDIASGMSHLHAENIIHLDLACRNLLVSFGANDQQQIKITDFGLSRLVESETYTASDTTFPVRWTAPETLGMGLVSRASDVWSFAVTMWEMIERKLPYADTLSSGVLEFLNSGKRLPRPTKLEIPDELWNLLEQCWQTKPEDRPTFEQICKDLSLIAAKFGSPDETLKQSSRGNFNGAFFLSTSDKKPAEEAPTHNATDYGARAEYNTEQITEDKVYNTEPITEPSQNAYGNATEN